MEDCYYFVTSTCNKGASCPFRHCEAARQATSICSAWLAGGLGCMDVNCVLRHSTFAIKRRSEIECYWQSHGGCKKMDCPFKHTAITEDEPSTPTNSTSIVATDRIKTTALVPPAELATPTAGAPKSTTVTLPPATNATAGDGKGEPSLMEHQTRKKSLDFEVKSLDEIMKEKRQKLQASPTPPRTPVAKVSTTASKSKVSSLTGLTKSIASLPPKVSTMVSKELIHAPMAATKRPSIPSGGVPMTMTMAESSTSPSRETPKTRPVIDRTVSAASKSTPSILDDDMIDEQFAEIERLINS